VTEADPSDSALSLRVRDTVDKQYLVIVVILLLVGVTGLWASYTVYIDPGTQTETRTVSEWRRTATFDHGATVTAENPVYDTGQRLRNQQAYFPQVSPVLTGEYQFGYAASDSGSADVDVTLRLILRGQRDGTVFWQRSRDVGGTTTAGVTPGNGIDSEFEFDMNRTRSQLERIDETFGQTPGEPVVLVQARTRVTGEINGRVVNREFVDELRFTPDGDAFVVRGPGEPTNTSRQTRTVQVPRERSPALGIGGLIAMVLGIGGVIGLIVARRDLRIRLTRAERDRLTRLAYAEWISRGSLSNPLDPDSEGVTEVSSLVDLVDVAADTDGRVLYDPDREQYAVFKGDHTYICEPPLERGSTDQPQETSQE